jgi:hypothetical protein
MAKIFVRERIRIGRGEGKPRFMLVAVEGVDLRIYAPHLRKFELEKLAEEVGAELVYLTSDGQPPDEGEGREHEKGRRGKGRRRKE